MLLFHTLVYYTEPEHSVTGAYYYKNYAMAALILAKVIPRPKQAMFI